MAFFFVAFFLVAFFFAAGFFVAFFLAGAFFFAGITDPPKPRMRMSDTPPSFVSNYISTVVSLLFNEMSASLQPSVFKAFSVSQLITKLHAHQSFALPLF